MYKRQVIDRTTGEVVPTEQWSYDSESGDVTIHSAKAFHDYTVSFLAYIMWDPVHMYLSLIHISKSLHRRKHQFVGNSSKCNDCLLYTSGNRRHHLVQKDQTVCGLPDFISDSENS